MATIVPTSAQRSRMMAGIRGKNTWPERNLRSLLFARGLRFRIHVRKLPGCPDLVFPRFKAVVFAHGCFWHRHHGCRYATTPRTNMEFWQSKFRDNIDRDKRHCDALLALGWRVATVWECALKHSTEDAVRSIVDWLHGNEETLVVNQATSTINAI